MTRRAVGRWHHGRVTRLKLAFSQRVLGAPDPGPALGLTGLTLTQATMRLAVGQPAGLAPSRFSNRPVGRPALGVCPGGNIMAVRKRGRNKVKTSAKDRVLSLPERRDCLTTSIGLPSSVLDRYPPRLNQL